jgi:hypothetical protein
VQRTLAETAAAEVGAAVAALDQRQRTVLELRDSRGCSHAEIARELALDETSAAVLLARARLALRERLRGSGAETGPCADADRALASLARRQDGEALQAPEIDWLYAHLRECAGCRQAHAAMLEAALRYRTWAVRQ